MSFTIATILKTSSYYSNNMDIKLTVRKWTLQNAVKYEGRASNGAVVGKIINEHPELKEKLRELMSDINKIIKEVNSLKPEKQLEELKKIAPELLEEKPKEQREGLKPLPNAEEGKVVMRFAPSPSGTLHIGRAMVLCLNDAYCKMYKGKMILRIEDTDPEKVDPEAYKLLEEDSKWITKNGITQVIIQSDRLGVYYDYAERMIQQQAAYVCTCTADAFRKLAVERRECNCRSLPKTEQVNRWAKMFSEYKPGEAVVRIKTNINDPNPAMRDWPALRINDHPHPKKGTEVKVWPLMNFAVAIDDYEMKITHTIRGKDHMDNEKKQKIVFDFFKWKSPTHLYIGRVNFIGLDLSASETKKKIAYGEYDGWDDIRLPFIPALKRRGYQPEAFIRFSEEMGVSQNDKTITAEDYFKSLNAFNKEILDGKSNRYFFIDDPVEIIVENAPKLAVEIGLHPEYKKRGSRTFSTNENFFITKNDYQKLKRGKLYRLMDCLNFKFGSKIIFDSREYEHYKEHGEMIMHWLPSNKELINIEVLMPDKSLRKGIGESSLSKLKIRDIVQLERFGFCRLDKKEKNKLVFWFGHK